MRRTTTMIPWLFVVVGCGGLADVTAASGPRDVPPDTAASPGPGASPSLPPHSACTQYPCVETIAGAGSIGDGVTPMGDGPALSVGLTGPSNVAVGHDGEVYFTDRAGVNGLRVLRGGQVTSLARTPDAFLDLPSRFWLPDALAVDADGSPLVADYSHRVRRFANARVTTVAGASRLPPNPNQLPSGGMVDGPVGVAEFNVPTGVAVGPDGAIYVADLANARLRVISAGQVSTLVELEEPWGVAVDPLGRVYATQRSLHRIVTIAAGALTVVAGDGSAGSLDGPANVARFSTPHGLAVDGGGRVFVADWGNHCVRVVENGHVSTLAGDGTAGLVDGPAASARFSGPTGVAVDDAGNVYVADQGNRRLRIIRMAPHR